MALGLKIEVENLTKGDIFLWAEYADQIYLCVDIDSAQRILEKYGGDGFFDEFTYRILRESDSIVLMYLYNQSLYFYIPVFEKTEVLLIEKENSEHLI